MLGLLEHLGLPELFDGGRGISSGFHHLAFFFLVHLGELFAASFLQLEHGLGEELDAKVDKAGDIVGHGGGVGLGFGEAIGLAGVAVAGLGTALW